MTAVAAMSCTSSGNSSLASSAATHAGCNCLCVDGRSLASWRWRVLTRDRVSNRDRVAQDGVARESLPGGGRLMNEEEQQKAPAISSGERRGARAFLHGDGDATTHSRYEPPQLRICFFVPPDLGRELYAGILQPATGANLYRDQPFRELLKKWHWSLSPIGTAQLVRTALLKRAGLPKDRESWQRSR
jgi:hypothetical protein